MKSNFPIKVFVWKNSSGLVKGTLDNAAVHFCHHLETYFSSKSEIFYGNIFLEKKHSPRPLSGKYDAFLTTCWNFLSILKHFHLNSKKMLENISFWRWCWRVSFRSPQNTRSNPKKKFSSRNFFLKTSSGHINCILTDLGEKNSEKVQTFFSHVRKNLLKTIFLKNQKALKWLFQHVKLTFVIPADSFLPNVRDFCSKSKKTNENKNSPKNILIKKSSGLVTCSFDNTAKIIPPNIPNNFSANSQIFGYFSSSQMNCFQAICFLVHKHFSSDKHAGIFSPKPQKLFVGCLKRILEFFSCNFPSK